MTKTGRWLAVAVLLIAGCNGTPMDMFEDTGTFDAVRDIAQDHAPTSDTVDVIDGDATGMDTADITDGLETADASEETDAGDVGCLQLDGAECPTVANADTTCTGGSCGYVCHTGFGDCDGNPANGCEVDLRADSNHCGTCAIGCPPQPNSTSMCVAGACRQQCNPGFADCNMLPGDGCEVQTSTDHDNCGTCGNGCSGALNAPPTCIGGTCAFVCASGWGNCNGTMSDGCEVNLLANVNHCGTCGTTCSSVPNAAAVCSGGTCGIACNPGYTDCNADLSDGCETFTAGSVSNCGLCGHACTAGPHVMMPACSSGTCSIGACSTGYADCNGSAGDGCEVDTQTDANNCGSCGNVCGTLTPTCSGGTCI